MSFLCGEKAKRIVRIICRIVITAAAIIYASFIGVGALVEPGPVVIEGVFITVFALAFITGTVFIFLKEKTGSIIIITAALAFAVFILMTAGDNQIQTAVFMSLPYLLPGILLYLINKCN